MGLSSRTGGCVSPFTPCLNPPEEVGLWLWAGMGLWTRFPSLPALISLSPILSMHERLSSSFFPNMGLLDPADPGRPRGEENLDIFPAVLSRALVRCSRVSLGPLFVCPSFPLSLALLHSTFVSLSQFAGLLSPPLVYCPSTLSLICFSLFLSLLFILFSDCSISVPLDLLFKAAISVQRSGCSQSVKPIHPVLFPLLLPLSLCQQCAPYASLNSNGKALCLPTHTFLSPCHLPFFLSFSFSHFEIYLFLFVSSPLSSHFFPHLLLSLYTRFTPFSNQGPFQFLSNPLRAILWCPRHFSQLWHTGVRAHRWSIGQHLRTYYVYLMDRRGRSFFQV